MAYLTPKSVPNHQPDKKDLCTFCLFEDLDNLHFLDAIASVQMALSQSQLF